MSVVLEMGINFQYNKSGIYPKFHCYPCYSQLIPYVRNLSLCTKHASTLIGATLLTQILANEIAITTFSLLPVKYRINFTATIETFVWAVKQVWY